jgi:hypothetical protein
MKEKLALKVFVFFVKRKLETDFFDVIFKKMPLLGLLPLYYVLLNKGLHS